MKFYFLILLAFNHFALMACRSNESAIYDEPTSSLTSENDCHKAWDRTRVAYGYKSATYEATDFLDGVKGSQRTFTTKVLSNDENVITFESHSSDSAEPYKSKITKSDFFTLCNDDPKDDASEEDINSVVDSIRKIDPKKRKVTVRAGTFEGIYITEKLTYRDGRKSESIAYHHESFAVAFLEEETFHGSPTELTRTELIKLELR